MLRISIGVKNPGANLGIIVSSQSLSHEEPPPNRVGQRFWAPKFLLPVVPGHKASYLLPSRLVIDPLYNQIIAGLDRLADGDKFEACANSLLREKYPFLTWIKGGNDAGFDGVGIQPDGAKVQLICTTQADVIGNVTNSLTRAREEKQHSDIVLVATSRRLSPEQKRNLADRIKEFGKTAQPVEDQPAFAELIYHSPRWRKELLGAPGHPPPLSLFPVSDRCFYRCRQSGDRPKSNT